MMNDIFVVKINCLYLILSLNNKIDLSFLQNGVLQQLPYELQSQQRI